MKTNLQIISAEAKEAKTGKTYVSFETSDGKMSAFDEPVLEPLMKVIGKKVSVEVEERNGFKNITKFYGDADGNLNMPTEQTVQDTPIPVAVVSKQQSMYTSYAKDVFSILCVDATQAKDKSDIMTEAIALVKQAREAFQ